MVIKRLALVAGLLLLVLAPPADAVFATKYSAQQVLNLAFTDENGNALAFSTKLTQQNVLNLAFDDNLNAIGMRVVGVFTTSSATFTGYVLIQGSMTVTGIGADGYSVDFSSSIRTGGCVEFGDGTIMCTAVVTPPDPTACLNGFVSRGEAGGADICVAVLDTAVDGSTLPVTSNRLFDHTAFFGTSAHGATFANTADQIVTRDGSGDFSAGNILGNADTDNSSAFGRARIGFCGGTDYACFAHYDRNSFGNYALQQSPLGETFLNASTGKSIRFVINSATQGQLLANGDWLFDAGTLFVDDSANSVGIGTENPATKLDVNGKSSLRGAVTISGSSLTVGGNIRAEVGSFTNLHSSGSITGSLTGAASLNVLKAGDTMTGDLIAPAGSFTQLHSTGDITTAGFYQGDGSLLTNLPPGETNTFASSKTFTDAVKVGLDLNVFGDTFLSPGQLAASTFTASFVQLGRTQIGGSASTLGKLNILGVGAASSIFIKGQPGQNPSIRMQTGSTRVKIEFFTSGGALRSQLSFDVSDLSYDALGGSGHRFTTDFGTAMEINGNSGNVSITDINSTVPIAALEIIQPNRNVGFNLQVSSGNRTNQLSVDKSGLTTIRQAEVTLDLDILGDSRTFGIFRAQNITISGGQSIRVVEPGNALDLHGGDFGIRIFDVNFKQTGGFTNLGFLAVGRHPVASAVLHVSTEATSGTTEVLRISTGTASSQILTKIQANGDMTHNGTLVLGGPFTHDSSTWTWDGTKYLAPPADGASGEVLGTDGSGNLDWTATVNTNAETICVGTDVYLDGEGNCDTISGGGALTSTFTTLGDEFTTTSIPWTSIPGSTVTLSMTGGRALIGYSCRVGNASTGFCTSLGVLVNGQFIDGETDTKGFTEHCSANGTRDEMGAFTHITVDTFSGSTDFSLLMRVDGSTGRVNLASGSACQFHVTEI